MFLIGATVLVVYALNFVFKALDVENGLVAGVLRKREGGCVVCEVTY